mgnify:CR=1 FL=1
MSDMTGVYIFFLSNLALFAILLWYFYLLPPLKFFVPQLQKNVYSLPDFGSFFKDEKVLSESPANIHLIATVSGSVRLALVDFGTKVQTVRIGSSIGGYKVVDIQRNYILLSNGQEKKAIGFNFELTKSLPTSLEIPSVSSPSQSLQATVSKREVESVTADPGIMFRQIRLVPYIQKGQTKGFLFEWVDPQSVFSKAGIRAGDVLIAINNQEIKSGEDAFRILQALRNENSLKINLIRDGQPLELNLRVE